MKFLKRFTKSFVSGDRILALKVIPRDLSNSHHHLNPSSHVRRYCNISSWWCRTYRIDPEVRVGHVGLVKNLPSRKTISPAVFAVSVPMFLQNNSVIIWAWASLSKNFCRQVATLFPLRVWTEPIATAGLMISFGFAFHHLSEKLTFGRIFVSHLTY